MSDDALPAGSSQATLDLPSAFATIGLRGKYEFRRATDVLAYLRDHPGAVPPLREAAPILAGIFGPDTPLVLDVPPDYEEEGVRRLYVRIGTSGEVDEALARLDRFYEGWWWPRMDAAPSTMHFTVEFVE